MQSFDHEKFERLAAPALISLSLQAAPAEQNASTLDIVQRIDMVGFQIPEPSAFQQISLASEIDELRLLEGDWDGYGALPISAEVCANAKLVATRISSLPLPEVQPNSNGTVSFSWESSSGNAHLEIGKTKFSWFVQPSHGAPSLGDGIVEVFDCAFSSVVIALMYPTLPASCSSQILVLGLDQRGFAGRYRRW